MAAAFIERESGPILGARDQGHAVRVLILVQRTADALMAAARQQADRTREDAEVAAHRLLLEARLDANRVQAEAETTLTEARATAEQIVEQAGIDVERIRHQAEKALDSARDQAARIVSEGQARAETLRTRAQQEFDESVGAHGPRRASLQQQIEALELFDSECRHQLTGVFQSQLRALWVPRSRPGEGRPAVHRGCRPRGHTRPS